MKICYISADASCYKGHTNRDASPGYPAETLLQGRPTRDGAPMRIGYIIREGIPNALPLVRVGQYIGKGTINQAEYLALIHALRHAARLRFDRAIVETDSQLVHCQVMGQYRVKARVLQPLHRELRELCRFFPGGVEVIWVGRGSNVEADKLTHETVWEGPQRAEDYDDERAIERWYMLREDLSENVAGRILGIDALAVRQIRKNCLGYLV